MSKPVFQRAVCLGILIGCALINPDLLRGGQDRESVSTHLNTAVGWPETGGPGSTLPSQVSSVIPPIRSSVEDESHFSTTKTLGSILFVLALILGIFICLKRYLPERFGISGNTRMIQVIENVSLGEKRSLVLVRIRDQNLLLASTPTNISLIKEIEFSQPSDASTAGFLVHNPDPCSREFADPGTDKSSPAGTTVRVAFRDVMASELCACSTSGRDGPRQLFSRLSEIQKRLRRRFEHSR